MFYVDTLCVVIVNSLLRIEEAEDMKEYSVNLTKLLSIFKEIKRLHVICKSQGGYSKVSYILNREKKVIYLINAKVASSSIKASILQLDNPEYNDDYNRVHVEALKSTKYISKKVNFIKNYQKYFRFTFVRNPYERLVSCYENKYHTDKKSVGKTLQQFHFDDYPFGFLKKDKGFSNFIIRICLIPDKFADEHFRSQCYSLYTKEGKCVVDYIGHFEHIKKDYDAICKKYGFNSLPHYNRATKGKWQDYYNPVTAWLVYRRFKEDFAKFGYVQEYKKLQSYLKNHRQSK